MRKISGLQKDGILAAMIFALWSMNLLSSHQPGLQPMPGTTPSSGYVVFLVTYLALHIVAFFFVVALFTTTIRNFAHKHKKTRDIQWRLLLYSYALACLAVSAYFTLLSVF